MRLAVSNIAWDPDENDAIEDVLGSHGVRGIEVAPTKLWPDWTGATAAAAADQRARFAERGFEIPALQAILFGRPDLLVFGEDAVKQALVDHVADVASLAAGLGARVLVFGSPRNRDPGERKQDEAFVEAQEVFRQMGEACAAQDVTLCIEPNPETYACRFMTSWREVKAMVDAVAHPGVGLHLDVACIALEGDDPVEAVEACAGQIAHFHVTEPELGDFASPTLAHAAIGRALRAADYPNWLSIEMRRSDDPVRSVDAAARQVMDWYG